MATQTRRMSVLGCVAAALLLLGSLGAATASAGAHERACGAAFGVLRRCAAAAGSQEAARGRCCGLLEIFHRNGCLCPGCPPGESSGAANQAGLLLAEELSPLLDLCGPTAVLSIRAINEQQVQQQLRQQRAARLRRSAAAAATIAEAVTTPGQAAAAAAAAAAGERAAAAAHLKKTAAAAAAELQAQERFDAASAEEAAAEFDEEEAMAEMAGRAAWAQDPRSKGHAPQGPLMDTPAYDHDNFLSDADTAFMLVDPHAAARYASRAADLAARLAAELAADVAGGREAAARVAAAVQERLSGLLLARGRGSGGAAEAASNEREESSRQQEEEEEELLASADAVGDDMAPAGRFGKRGGGEGTVRLASRTQLPRTPEQRRAQALARAVERQQAQNLARKAADQLAAQLLGGAVAAGGAAAGAAGGRGEARKKLSVDITIDANNPEAARRMADSIAALLRSWQAAAGSASSQAELAAALESAVQRLAAAAAAEGGSLGRPELLQPKKVLVQQVEEGEARTCACMEPEAAAADSTAANLPSAIQQRYAAARLALCRFACTHERLLTVLLVAELALCVAWLALWLLRTSGCTSGGEGRQAAGGYTFSVPTAAAGYAHPCGSQFLVATAADPGWHAVHAVPAAAAELEDSSRPLLAGCSRSSSDASLASH